MATKVTYWLCDKYPTYCSMKHNSEEEAQNCENAPEGVTEWVNATIEGGVPLCKNTSLNDDVWDFSGVTNG